MSHPYYDIECTACHYKAQYGYNVLYEYEGGRDVVCQPDLLAGWCEDCERIRMICAPVTDETVKKDVDLLSQWIAEETQKGADRKSILFQRLFGKLLLGRCYTPEPTLSPVEKSKKTDIELAFGRIFPSKTGSKYKVDEEAIERWSNRIKELNECVRFFRDNRFPMKCLTCGSVNVTPVCLPSEFCESIHVGVKHRCGGDIVARKSGRIAYVNSPKVVYDIQGNTIRIPPQVDLDVPTYIRREQ